MAKLRGKVLWQELLNGLETRGIFDCEKESHINFCLLRLTKKETEIKKD
jgi:hypothetical protein